MKLQFALSTILLLSLFISTSHGKPIDPYKVLGVKKDASQREIQKAFHKLSLQYHPDKNKDKGAQAKFEEINNAYEILSDEEKRKNYDLYGDERGNQGFDAGYPGQDSGYTYYTSGGKTPNGFNFRPGGWQNMGGQGGSRSFSFSFGGPSASSFGFGGLDDIFGNMFGGNKFGGRFQGFGGSSKSRAKPQSGPRSSSKSIRAVTSQVFKKEIVDAGMTWLLLSQKSDLLASEYFQSTLQEVADSLQGSIKVGMVDCMAETSFCREVGILPKKNPRLFVYSYKNGGKGSLVEYGGDLVAKDVKTFCQDHLPRFSERIEPRHIDSLFGKGGKLPRVLLLSTKKDTPVIWRVISGLYHKRITFNDVQAHDLNDPMMKRLGVDGLPALVGWLSNGEKCVLKTGISVKDLKSAIQDLSKLLDDFEKQNKKVVAHTGKPESASEDRKVPLLSASNFGDVCSETNPVCIIGAFRSSKAREKLESILFMVSQKSLSRRQSSVSGSRESISYSLVDGARQPAFLSALDKSGFKSSDKLLIAYKPRRGKFAAFEGGMTAEEVERFIGAVLNGDIQFKKVRQKPVVKGVPLHQQNFGDWI